jgi:NAD(P)-dependent dehydrogenase (short-subunit alcohol dehydrogenase family)
VSTRPVARDAFADRVVVVTGASAGIGAELARQFAAAGARLALAARDESRLEAVAAECRAAGAETLVVRTDVGEEQSCKAMVDAVVAHFGRLDILVNNAGIGASGLFEETTDLSVFERVMRINFHGTVWCTAYALPHLLRSRGQVVGISSLTGLTGVPKRTAYGATKHAMAGFFDALRIEMAGRIAVTVIYPSFVLSDLNRHALSPDGTPYGDRAFVRTTKESMETDEACRQMMHAIHRRDRDLVMTWKGKLGRYVKLLSPALVDRIAKRTIDRRQ